VKEREAPKQTAAEPEDELVEVDEIMQRIQESLANGGAKPTVADLIRLLELRRELARSQSSLVTVRWIDECQPTPAGGE
jgi:hypothetical protein